MDVKLVAVDHIPGVLGAALIPRLNGNQRCRRCNRSGGSLRACLRRSRGCWCLHCRVRGRCNGLGGSRGLCCRLCRCHRLLRGCRSRFCRRGRRSCRSGLHLAVVRISGRIQLVGRNLCLCLCHLSGSRVAKLLRVGRHLGITEIVGVVNVIAPQLNHIGDCVVGTPILALGRALVVLILAEIDIGHIVGEVLCRRRIVDLGAQNLRGNLQSVDGGISDHIIAVGELCVTALNLNDLIGIARLQGSDLVLRGRGIIQRQAVRDNLRRLVGDIGYGDFRADAGDHVACAHIALYGIRRNQVPVALLVADSIIDRYLAVAGEGSEDVGIERRLSADIDFSKHADQPASLCSRIIADDLHRLRGGILRVEGDRNGRFCRSSGLLIYKIIINLILRGAARSGIIIDDNGYTRNRRVIAVRCG